jgi:hypothetical protein
LVRHLLLALLALRELLCAKRHWRWSSCLALDAASGSSAATFVERAAVLVAAKQAADDNGVVWCWWVELVVELGLVLVVLVLVLVLVLMLFLVLMLVARSCPCCPLAWTA